MCCGALDFRMTGAILDTRVNLSNPSKSSSRLFESNRALKGTEEMKSSTKRPFRYAFAMIHGSRISVPDA